MKPFIIFILLLCSLSAFSQNSPQVKELEKKRKETLAEIEATTKLLNETKKTQSNVLERLNLLTQQITSRRQLIALMNDEVISMNQEIKTMEVTIVSLEKDLQEKKEKYAQSLRRMGSRRKSTQDKLLFILSAEDFAQSYRRVRYLKEYAAWQKLQGEDIMQRQADIQKKKEDLQKTRQNKLALLHDKENEADKLRREEDTHQQEMQSLKKEEKQLQANLTQKKQQARELNRQIEKAINEEIARAEEEARVAAEMKNKKKGTSTAKTSTSKKTEEVRVAETEGGYAMTKEERALSSNFSNNKGNLPFPIKGSYKIVGHFGQQKHQDLKYVVTNNNGIDIQTTPNNDALAVFDGEVTRIFVVAGYNNSIIVRHGNYLTVYSNLSEVYVKSGTKVKTGQAIGKIFTDTENANSTILHFELWKERDKLNPESWID